ncbi:MAG: T9SS type A sorting domain-containing protein [Flavobacteriales bacterium]|nr:T9SS type A sorting domain-containing protein [Flavobacteriales bacterium]
MRILTLSLLLWALPALAEHLPGGNISVRCVSGNQHEVTLKLWRECTGVPMISQSINFVSSCGVTFALEDIPLISVANVSPICEGQADQTTCDGGTLIGIEEYTYRTNVFLSPCNFWRIYWSTCCRFPALNLQGSQGIYIEALVNNQGGNCIEYPTFSDDVPPLVCVNQPVSYDPGVVFAQGQDLRFRLIEARRLLNADPQNLDIQSVGYQSPFTGPEPYTGLVIDSLTGQITFTPLGQGYIVCVVAIEVRDADGIWRGTIMRDFPFIAQVCDNNVPDAASGVIEGINGAVAATGIYTLDGCGAGCFTVAITDADAGQTVSLESNFAIPGGSIELTPGNPASASVCLDGSAPEGNYLFTITATDDACPVIGTQVFTYSISVLANAGAGEDASVPLCPGETIDLSDFLTGEDGGIWSEGPIVSAIGAYTYTVQGVCGEDSAVIDVVAGTAPDAGSDAVIAICVNSSVDLAEYVNGSGGGVWSDGPEVNQPGDYTYTVSNGCGSDVAVFTVNLIPVPYAGEPNTILSCPQQDAFNLLDSLLGTPDPDGSWVFEDQPVSGTFDPTLNSEGDYCYIVSHPQCGADTACVRVNFVDASDPYCLTLGVTEAATGPTLHPNPSQGTLVIGVELPSRAEVIDALGRLAWSSQLRTGVNTIDLPASLVNGSYAMRITRPDGHMTVARFELIR